MKQVQEAYHLPPSRKALCEGLMLSGYCLSPHENKQVNNFDRLRYWETAWKKKMGEDERGRGSFKYSVVCMRNMADVTEITWGQQKPYRDHIDELYKKRPSENMQMFWDELLPGVNDATHETIMDSKLNWEQHEIIWKNLEKCYDEPNRVLFAQNTWGFEKTEAEKLWNLVYEVKNAQKQLQIGMDQLFSAMILRLNILNTNELESDRVEAIKHVSKNIYKFQVFGRHMLDAALGKKGVLYFLEKNKPLSKEDIIKLFQRLSSNRELSVPDIKNSPIAKKKRPE
ncbi:hypothetical protein CROQUDRAFT_366716 [Cronartium quercuum f. sp. fusiforme G11]|uniref:Uncharacterized protein n=1 Tax=Cronartium quercuum f. sp. fusiforme G11 TaxID=708437 RepID=A0A9P6T695_9BASI|nr:hypothetical protein CROQUDRAFT_366716 [Cronartium quercuum f. sp. fusiforme G11]